MIYELFLEIV